MSSSSNAASAAPPLVGAQVHHYAEETCWGPDDQLRSSLQQVAFRLYSVGAKLGQKIDVGFMATYAIYFGSGDEYLLHTLQQACPSVQWSQYVLHCWLDRSRIQVLDPETGHLLAQIETRRYYGRKVGAAALASGMYGANVVSLAVARAAVEAEALASSGQDSGTVEGE